MNNFESLLSKANALLPFPIDKEELHLCVGTAIVMKDMYKSDPAASATTSILNSLYQGQSRSQGYSLDEACKFITVLDLVREYITNIDESKPYSMAKECDNCESMAQMIEILEKRRHVPVEIIDVKVKEMALNDQETAKFKEGVLFTEEYMHSFATMADKV